MNLETIGRSAEELQSRLIGKRKITDSGCWEYTGARTSHRPIPYGSMRIKTRTYGAHQVAAVAWIGEIPEGGIVCHKCDNPPCFNPEHLYIGTLKTNATDMITRGRGRGQLTTESTRGTKHYGNRLSESDVVAIKSALKNNRRGLMADLARQYRVTIQLIYRIHTGKAWEWLCV